MNDYKFKKHCCGILHDIRWDKECRECGGNFLKTKQFGEGRKEVFQYVDQLHLLGKRKDDEKMEKKFYAMVLSNEEEVIVYQGDKEAVLAVQGTYDFNKYGMSLIETNKQIKVQNIQVSELTTEGE